MTYSGATQVRVAREALGKALEALQKDSNIPEDVLAVAQNIAQAVGALFEAERASSEPDGKASVRSALGSLSQTLALLQDVRGEHQGIAVATQVIAQSMSGLYPLTTIPSKAPSAAPPAHMGAPMPHAMPAPAVPSVPAVAPIGMPPSGLGPAGTLPLTSQAQAAARAASAHAQPVAQAPRTSVPATAASLPPVPAEGRAQVEANIGATTESNFYVGFSGEVSEGGVFLATYETYPRGTAVQALVTLPGGFEMRVLGRVRFVRDPLDFSADSEPGMGIQFEMLRSEDRELILRFIRKRPPMFYDE
jgi:uncharacterized protein (TIGR02266 family)